MRLLQVLLALVLILLPAPVRAEEGTGATRQRPNFLIVVADDVGTDHIGLYGKAASPGPTPNIDRLGRHGLVFTRFWAMPSCSPSRAALLTGLYPGRTGIGSSVRPKPRRGVESGPERFGLSEAVETLPRALGRVGYASAILGKWHLATRFQGTLHPLRVGFAHHRGSLGNLGQPGGSPSYESWAKNVDGEVEVSTTYATTDSVDEAIALAGRLAEPWLLVVSFNAAHRPAHAPPPALHSYTGLTPGPGRSPLLFRAMVEAMDTEIGRLLEKVAPHDPFVFFLGDNGSPEWAYPLGNETVRAKRTVFERGIRVPLIVQHASLASPGRQVRGLANITDLFATLLELSGAPPVERAAPTDSVSLVPYFRSAASKSLRDSMYAERFTPNGGAPYRRRDAAVRDHRYKLIRRSAFPDDLFYDLEADPSEQNPLPLDGLEGEPARAFARLAALLETVQAESLRVPEPGLAPAPGEPAAGVAPPD